MNAREQLHRLVNLLPEQQLEDLLGYLEDLQGPADGRESLSRETEAAIEEGLADIRAGRTVSWEEIKRENGL